MLMYNISAIRLLSTSQPVSEFMLEQWKDNRFYWNATMFQRPKPPHTMMAIVYRSFKCNYAVNQCYMHVYFSLFSVNDLVEFLAEETPASNDEFPSMHIYIYSIFRQIECIKFAGKWFKMDFFLAINFNKKKARFRINCSFCVKTRSISIWFIIYWLYQH